MALSSSNGDISDQFVVFVGLAVGLWLGDRVGLSNRLIKIRYCFKRQ